MSKYSSNNTATPPLFSCSNSVSYDWHSWSWLLVCDLTSLLSHWLSQPFSHAIGWTISWLYHDCLAGFENNKLTYRLPLLWSEQKFTFQTKTDGHSPSFVLCRNIWHMFETWVFDTQYTWRAEGLGVNKLQHCTKSKLNLESIINPVSLFTTVYSNYNVNWRDKSFIALMNIE